MAVEGHYINLNTIQSLFGVISDCNYLVLFQIVISWCCFRLQLLGVVSDCNYLALFQIVYFWLLNV